MSPVSESIDWIELFQPNDAIALRLKCKNIWAVNRRECLLYYWASLCVAVVRTNREEATCWKIEVMVFVHHGPRSKTKDQACWLQRCLNNCSLKVKKYGFLNIIEVPRNRLTHLLIYWGYHTLLDLLWAFYSEGKMLKYKFCVISVDIMVCSLNGPHIIFELDSVPCVLGQDILLI